MKKYSFYSLIFGFLVLLSSCKTTQTTQIEKIPYSTRTDVEFLASDKLEGRDTGSEGERLAANYIIKRFGELGISPKGEDGSYLQSFSKILRANPHATETSPDDVIIKGNNVVGYLDNKAKNTIVIGAHYDHLGYGHQGSLFAGDPAIHNGADDNASGTAALMEIARVLARGLNTNNNYMFIAFSGEEKGLLGSNYYVKNPTIDLNKVNYMINMDMVGRLGSEKKLLVYGTGTSPSWNEVLKNSKSSNFEFIFKESGVGPSDHTSFYLQDIPVLHFFTGQHEQYHKPDDDAHLVNYEGLNDVADYILHVIGKLNKKGKLVFTKTKDESEDVPAFKVTLGVIPDYLFDGAGMRIDGIREGKPAENAGLLKGDVVVKLGKHEVINMMSYMRALSKFEPGSTTTVTVKRGDQEIETELSFEQ